ncbi:MAG: porin family protein [Xanthobacteraceae bacterium]|nr:porin family protein [Xanthobacteraceae bacterium]MBV9237184.1 porin family protein [Xanthobacteraceae bacterium]
MKKLAIALLSASALCAGLCQGASAADLGVRAAPPPAPVVIAPTWTGFYIGGNVGAGWAKNDTSVGGVLPATVVGTAVPFSIPLTSQTMSGFIGGVQGGYNYQFGTFLVGVEADGDWGKVDGTAPCLVVVSCYSKVKSLVDVGGRAGVIVDKALIYVKGGGAWAWTDFNAAVSIAGLSAAQNVSTNRSGAFLGTGIEYAFMPNWTAKVEYDYYDFGTKTISTSVAAAGVVLPVSATSKLTEQTVKFGVNYKFWAY